MAVLISTLLLSTLTACDSETPKHLINGLLNGKNVEKVYKEAREKLTSKQKVAIDGIITEKVSYNGETQEFSFNMKEVVNEPNLYMNLSSDMAEPMNINMEMWYVDEVLYETAGGENFKFRMDPATFSQSGEATDYSQTLLMEQVSDFFKDAEFKEREDGDFEVSFTMNLESYFDTLFSDIIASTLGELADTSMENPKLLLIFSPEGEIKKMQMEFSLSIDVEGVTIQIDMQADFDIEFNVEIPALPEGAENWTDYTDLLEGAME